MTVFIKRCLCNLPEYFRIDNNMNADSKSKEESNRKFIYCRLNIVEFFIEFSEIESDKNGFVNKQREN